MNCFDNDLLTVLRYIRQILKDSNECLISTDTQIGSLNDHSVQVATEVLIKYEFVRGYSVAEPDITGTDYTITSITAKGLKFLASYQ